MCSESRIGCAVAASLALALTGAVATAEVSKHLLTVEHADAESRVGASVSVSGDRIAVGSTGRAYVFRLDGEDWLLEAELEPDAEDDASSAHVSVSLDGERCVLGLPWRHPSLPGEGCAYVFRHEGDKWIQEAALSARDAKPARYQALSVSLSGDYCAVGMPSDDTVARFGGAVYIFRRAGTKWVQDGKLLLEDAGTVRSFGASVSLDGEYCAIGRAQSDVEWRDGVAGSVYVFQRIDTTWTRAATLTPDNAAPHALLYPFSVAIDDDRVLVGGFRVGRSGAAFVFHRRGAEWVQEATLQGHDVHGSSFGGSVAICGERVVVGAINATAYVFARADEGWTEIAQLRPEHAAHLRDFAQSVAVSDCLIAVGAPFQKGAGKDAGGVYVWDFRDGDPHIGESPSAPVRDPNGPPSEGRN